MTLVSSPNSPPQRTDRRKMCIRDSRRMMTLAKRKYNMDDSILLQIMVEAYPIIVFTKQMEERSRKIMEIIEGEDYQDGRLIAHSLYKYEVDEFMQPPK